MGKNKKVVAIVYGTLAIHLALVQLRVLLFKQSLMKTFFN